MNKRTNIIFFVLSLFLLSSCTDFLDRYPGDEIPKEKFWKTENDAKLALIGCYSLLEDPKVIMYWDCTSDNAFRITSDTYKQSGNGSISASEKTLLQYFDFSGILNCNEFIQNIDKVKFKDENIKKIYSAEVRFIRAYRYFKLTRMFGDVPFFVKNFDNPEDSKIPKTPKDKIEEFIITELKDIINILPEYEYKKDVGKIRKSAAQALLARLYLYKGDYTESLAVSKDIKGHKLFPSYDGLFRIANKNCEEVILNVEAFETFLKNDLTPFYPNSFGGWSSSVPLQSLVDTYEMADGKTIEEAQQSGEYDKNNPFVNRDPRLRQTIVYPGQSWQGKTYSSIVVGDPDYRLTANNSSKSGYNWKKYISDLSDFPLGITNTERSIMLFRYAETLLNIAECKVELGQIDDELYDAINQVRTRAGMPEVDRSKYNNQDKLRELVRRERRVEFAFEGLRRDDIIRWGIAEKVLNGPTVGCSDGEILDDADANGDKKLNLNQDPIFVENRNFDKSKNNLFPIPQKAIDKNPNLTQNPGY